MGPVRAVLRWLWRILFRVHFPSYLLVGGFAAFTLYFLYLLLSGPFGMAEDEFVDLSGPAAASREFSLVRWPESIEPKDVRKISGKYASFIDQHSKWLRI